jgi:hypothetical protein
MTIDRRIAILLWLAAAVFAVGLVPAADLLHDLPLDAKWAFSGLCTLGALVLFAKAAFLTWQDEQAAPKADRRRKMIALVGMIVFGCGFIGCSAWYFWPSKTSQEAQDKATFPEIPYIMSGGKNEKPIRVVAGVANYSKTRMHNVHYTFIAKTIGKARKGAGQLFYPLIERESVFFTEFELEAGGYLIMIETDSGRWRETLDIEVSDDRISREIIRIYEGNEDGKPIFEKDSKR